MELITLKKIKTFSESTTSEINNPLHDFEHLERVKRNADKIVNFLGLKDKLDINLLYAACYLHDVPVNISKKYLFGSLGMYFFEKKIIRKHLPSILDRFSISQNDKNILYEALVNHPFSIPFRDLNKDGGIYTKILQDADSLDYFSFQRQEILTKKINIKIFYILFSNIIKPFFIIGRKTIGIFLNYPEISKTYKF